MIPSCTSKQRLIDLPSLISKEDETSRFEQEDLRWPIPNWLPPAPKLSTKLSNHVNAVPSSNLSQYFHTIKKIVERKWKWCRSDHKKLHSKNIDELLKLAQENPLFNEIWQQICKTTTVSVVSEEILEFRTNNCNSKAISTNCFSHANISIANGVDFQDALRMLVFEAINVLQHYRFNAVEERAGSGLLDRETFTFLTEYIEWDTNTLADVIVNYGITQQGWPQKPEQVSFDVTFDSWWSSVNVTNKTVSHADSYRITWDKKYASAFYLENPEITPNDFDWNQCDEEGRNILYQLVRNREPADKTKLIKRLIEKCPDQLNQRSSSGSSALSLLLFATYRDIFLGKKTHQTIFEDTRNKQFIISQLLNAKLLLELGADPNIQKSGHTSIDWAILIRDSDSAFREAANDLLEIMARPD